MGGLLRNSVEKIKICLKFGKKKNRDTVREDVSFIIIIIIFFFIIADDIKSLSSTEMVLGC